MVVVSLSKKKNTSSNRSADPSPNLSPMPVDLPPIHPDVLPPDHPDNRNLNSIHSEKLSIRPIGRYLPDPHPDSKTSLLSNPNIRKLILTEALPVEDTPKNIEEMISGLNENKTYHISVPISTLNIVKKNTNQIVRKYNNNRKNIPSKSSRISMIQYRLDHKNYGLVITNNEIFDKYVIPKNMRSGFAKLENE